MSEPNLKKMVEITIFDDLDDANNFAVSFNHQKVEENDFSMANVILLTFLYLNQSGLINNYITEALEYWGNRAKSEDESVNVSE